MLMGFKSCLSLENMYFMSIKYTALHTVVAILYHVNQRVNVIFTYWIIFLNV